MTDAVIVLVQRKKLYTNVHYHNVVFIQNHPGGCSGLLYYIVIF